MLLFFFLVFFFLLRQMALHSSCPVRPAAAFQGTASVHLSDLRANQSTKLTRNLQGRARVEARGDVMLTFLLEIEGEVSLQPKLITPTTGSLRSSSMNSARAPPPPGLGLTTPGINVSRGSSMNSARAPPSLRGIPMSPTLPATPMTPVQSEKSTTFNALSAPHPSASSDMDTLAAARDLRSAEPDRA
jgi:hypothetical protein